MERTQNRLGPSTCQFTMPPQPIPALAARGGGAMPAVDVDTYIGDMGELLARRPQYARRLRARYAEVHARPRPCSCFEEMRPVFVEFLAQYKPGRLRGSEPSRDVKAGSQLLLNKLFSPRGDCLIDAPCAKALFGLGNGRFVKLHEEAVRRAEHPIEEMTKGEVPRARYNDIIAPTGGNGINMLEWWTRLRDSDVVRLRTNFLVHGNTGNTGNNRYSNEIRALFDDFLERSSAPTGRRSVVDGRRSYHPLRYFEARFRRICSYGDEELASYPDDAETRARVASESVFMSFRREMREKLHVTSEFPVDTTLWRWFHPKWDRTAIRPHYSDYCDECAALEKQMRELQAVVTRLGHTSRGPNVLSIQQQLDALKKKKADHTLRATIEREAYTASYPRTASRDPHQAVRAIDYMMERLLPYYGRASQAGETYYKQKLVAHVFGVTDSAEGALQRAYITDEYQDGSKSADHLLSYLEHVVRELPPDVTELTIWGDNAATIKSRYLAGWATELMARADTRLSELHLRFMLPGHTKFAPDALFSVLSGRFREDDSCSAEDLARQAMRLVSTSSDPDTTAAAQGGRGTRLRAYVFNADRIGDYRASLDTRYNALPGIRNVRHFIFRRVGAGQRPELFVSDSNGVEPRRRALPLRRNLDVASALSVAMKETPLGLDLRKLADVRLSLDSYQPEGTTAPTWLATANSATRWNGEDRAAKRRRIEPGASSGDARVAFVGMPGGGRDGDDAQCDDDIGAGAVDIIGAGAVGMAAPPVTGGDE